MSLCGRTTRQGMTQRGVCGNADRRGFPISTALGVFPPANPPDQRTAELVASARASDAIPPSCYVSDPALYPRGMADIHCPKSNITIFPTIFPSSVKHLGKAVDLPQNRIRTVPGFSRVFTFVRRLNLSENLITTFNWESLKHLKNLGWLDLSYNQLSTVRLDLAGLKNVVAIGLAFNKLAVFSAADLGLTAFGFMWLDLLFIHGNPIHCDCRMAWLSEMDWKIYSCWHKKCNGPVRNHPFYRAFTDVGVPHCGSPKHLKNLEIGSTDVYRRINNQACSNNGTREPVPHTSDNKAGNFKPCPKQSKFAFHFV
ncbi:hypothetical protein Bbelb_310960 [Branchiostoma belcheri]|nr:hypothetical protein Bbelb_310960 [Branchiostoma belcheri]